MAGIFMYSVFWLVLVVTGIRYAYRNGCVDGYGAAREPGNPGYQRARRFLQKTMMHRWDVK